MSDVLSVLQKRKIFKTELALKGQTEIEIVMKGLINVLHVAALLCPLLPEGLLFLGTLADQGRDVTLSLLKRNCHHSVLPLFLNIHEIKAVFQVKGTGRQKKIRRSVFQSSRVGFHIGQYRIYSGGKEGPAKTKQN